jgi:alpha-1,2-mannosyltransferase
MLTSSRIQIRARSLAGSRPLLLAGIAALALVTRLTPLLIGGGLGSYGRYDDGVYYAASDAFTFGRVPYRDFVLLHPPGIVLVLAPFALLGRVTSDPAGMAVARLAFVAIGALNAVLVAMLADRWGRGAAVMTGVLYACWLPTVYSEQSTLLEPLGGTALLIALLLLVNSARPSTARAEMISGLVLGLAVAMKIWYVAPWVAVALWLFVVRRRRAALRVIVAGALALALVLLPFFVLAGGKMFDMVVRDQLLRPQAPSSRLARLSSILGVRTFFVGHHGELVTASVLAVLVLLIAAVGCWTEPTARVFVIVGTVNLAVLLASPSYFAHYAALTAVPAALVLGVGLMRLSRSIRYRLAPAIICSLSVLMFLTSGVSIAATAEGKTFPGARFARAAPPGCVAADDPQALIQMNRLSRDLGAHCRVAIDVTGITYDSLHRVTRGGSQVSRRDNGAWQSYLSGYLVSGESFVVARKHGDALAPSSARRLARRPALARSRGLVLRTGFARSS